MRVIWKGSISFGLVNVPVGLYTGEESSHKLSLSMVDQRDMNPVGYKKYNKETGDELDSSDVAKAYELEDGRMVLVEKEDFEKADPKRSKTVEILDFVPGEDIPPMFFEKPYYLVPEKSGRKAYVILREAVRETGKVGVAKVVLRSKERLAVLLPWEDMLVLDLVRFGDELRSIDQFDVPHENAEQMGTTEREMTMAKALVDGMSSDWEPERYADEYQEKLLKIIHRKAEGEDIEPEELEEFVPADRVVDLTEILKESVERAKGGRPTA